MVTTYQNLGGRRPEVTFLSRFLEVFGLTDVIRPIALSAGTRDQSQWTYRWNIGCEVPSLCYICAQMSTFTQKSALKARGLEVTEAGLHIDCREVYESAVRVKRAEDVIVPVYDQIFMEMDRIGQGLASMVIRPSL